MFIKALRVYVMQSLMVGDAVFVFDRHFKDSTKAYLRQLRQEKRSMSRVHVLRPDMPAPPKQTIIGVTRNKMVEEVLMDPEFHIPSVQNGHSLPTVGVNDVLIEIKNGVGTEREDLISSQF